MSPARQRALNLSIYWQIVLFHNLIPLSIKQVKDYSNPLIGFSAHAIARAPDAFTDLIELTFETNKLPIGRRIVERQDEGHYRHGKITYDQSTQVAMGYCACALRSRA